MLVPGAVGPLISLGGLGGTSTFWEVVDCLLLRPDCAFVILRVFDNDTDDYFFRFQVLDPNTGALLATTDTATFHRGDPGVPAIIEPSMVKIDEHTAFFLAWPEFGLTAMFAGRFSDNGTLVTNIFTIPHHPFANEKEMFYACWDPYRRLVSIQEWTVYFGHPSVAYGVAVNVDTLEIDSTWPLVVGATFDQFGIYYESFATTFPGYGGGIGVRYTGDPRGPDFEQINPTRATVEDNTGRVLYEIPTLPVYAQTDFSEVFIQQCADDPDVVAIAWQEYDGARDFIPGYNNTSSTRLVLFQMYPVWKQLSGPILIGTYPNTFADPFEPATSPLQQYLSFNLYDMPRQFSTQFALSSSWSAFDSTGFGNLGLPKDIMPLGMRDIATTEAWTLGEIQLEPPLAATPGDPFENTNGIASPLGALVLLAGLAQTAEAATPAREYNFMQLFGLKTPSLRLTQRIDGLGVGGGPRRLIQASGSQNPSQAPRRLGGVNTYH